MNKLSKISIIIPTYNRSKLLIETLQSVKNQTFENWECIIVDDGSIDNTEEEVNKFVFEDNRFKFEKRPEFYPKGACSCRNYGFEKSNGKYIQWLDDDDLLSKNKLEFQFKKLEQYDNSYIFTTCDWDLFWKGKNFENQNILKSNTFFTKRNFFKELRNHQSFYPCHTFLIPKNLILKAGLWNNNLTLNDDAEFMTRVLLASEKLITTDGCFVLYRSHFGERLSEKKGGEGLTSLILSLNLMHANLKAYNIICKPYFKWKLFNIFFNNWNSNKDIIKNHYYFFKENGINLSFSNYYILKHSVYKMIYPLFKKHFKKITK